MLELLTQIIQRVERAERFGVCVVAATRGSTPQKSGAIMVVLLGAQTLGTIGGGCVEAEVRVRTLQMMEAGGTALLNFNLDHDHGWDDGLVCGGNMTVAVQILGTAESVAPYRAARDRLLEGEAADLNISVQDAQSNWSHFVLPIPPPPRLIIAGAGHVGSALALIAQQMGFAVTVIDDRADYASAARFPGALCRVGAVETELGEIQINAHTYVVIVTRGHRRDALALAAVIGSPAAYIGLIGSKRKVITIYQELQLQAVSSEAISRVHAPIGLDIGAVTPAEIAVSIAAELIAVRRAKQGPPFGAMRLTAEQIQRISE